MRKRTVPLVVLAVCVLSAAVLGGIRAARGAGAALNQAAASAILEEFDREIAFIEQRQGVSISRVDGTTLPVIQEKANRNLGNPAFRFGDMMDGIALAFAGQEAAAQAQPHVGRREIRNRVTTAYIPYGALRVQYETRVSKDCAASRGGALGIAIGGPLGAINLSAGRAVSNGYTVYGPLGGEQLFDGNAATHSYLCGVLYGTVLKTQWDLYDKRTDRLVSHHESYAIQDSTANVMPYTCRAYINSDGALYIDSADPAYGRTAVWSSHPAFTSGIAENPGLFLEGRSE